MKLFDLDGFIEESFAALLLLAKIGEKAGELTLEARLVKLDVA